MAEKRGRQKSEALRNGKQGRKQLCVQYTHTHIHTAQKYDSIEDRNYGGRHCFIRRKMSISFFTYNKFNFFLLLAVRLRLTLFLKILE